MVVWHLSPVMFALLVCLKHGEENESENKWKDKEPRYRFVENAVQVAELDPKSSWVSKLQKLSVSAAVAKRGPFQPTNRSVWKMEGARRRSIVVVVSRRARWRCSASCNGDFAIAIARMHADRDGDARTIAWCDSHAGWRVRPSSSI